MESRTYNLKCIFMYFILVLSLMKQQFLKNKENKTKFLFPTIDQHHNHSPWTKFER